MKRKGLWEVHQPRKTKHATLKSKSAPVVSVTVVAVPETALSSSEIDVITLDDNSESDSDVVILVAPVINSKNKRSMRIPISYST